jgi:hypothetical protein
MSLRLRQPVSLRLRLPVSTPVARWSRQRFDVMAQYPREALRAPLPRSEGGMKHQAVDECVQTLNLHLEVVLRRQNRLHRAPQQVSQIVVHARTEWLQPGR